MRLGVIGVAAVLAWAVPTVAQSQKKIQCWTDKDGQRVCGDRVPQDAAGQRRDVVKDGRVVQTIKPTQTPEEIAEEQRKKKLAEEAKRQADYDRALLETYRSAKDIEAMRDERVALIDGRMTAAQKIAADTDKTLEGLRARAEALKKEGKPVNEVLAKQLVQFEAAQKDNHRAIDRYQKERDEVVAKFGRDLERYNLLHSGEMQAPSPQGNPVPGMEAAHPAAAPAKPAQPAKPPAPKG